VLVLVMVFTLPSQACGSSEDDGHADDHSMAVDPCDDPRVDDFRVGTTIEGDSLRMTILDASPAFPIRDDNAWTVMLTDRAGISLENVELTVEPWMPDHGHGARIDVEVTERGDGELHLEPLRLHMAGVWEVSFHVTREAEPLETLVLTVCVD
jgi:hypothetical protein